VVADLRDRVRNRERYELEGHWTRFASGTRLEGAVRYVTKIWHLTHSDEFTGAMRSARDTFDALEFDPFRVKPIVKLMGEFWAQTTEGPGNFHIHRFLEQEGAEVYVDRSLFTRLSYMLFMHREKTRDRRGLREGEGRLGHYLRYARKMALLGVADRLLHRENRRLVEALGGTLHEMLDQDELELLARPYWNWRTTSGEGHLEIAENIYYHTHHLCHMVLSVKPFSCMPSTQSDGVQVRVVEDHPGMIYLPIETSGDGEVIAHSRVQMALGSARAKARKEMDDIVAASPWTLDEIRDWADDHPHVKRPSYRVPHAPGVVGRAANLALHVSGRMEARAPAVPVTREVHDA
jgi:predicted nucleotide-binding protein (sugar kinase/HSP70/actin superfamily)